MWERTTIVITREEMHHDWRISPVPLAQCPTKKGGESGFFCVFSSVLLDWDLLCLGGDAKEVNMFYVEVLKRETLRKASSVCVCVCAMNGLTPGSRPRGNEKQSSQQGTQELGAK